MGKKSKKHSDNTIAQNRKARHEYTIEKHFEAGIVLQGWEVKSLRLGKAQVADSYVVIKRGEAWLLGANITPLQTASTHIKPEPARTRKLLLHKKELKSLIGLVEQRGYTLVALSLYWKNNRVKLDVGLAKGKKKHDKRETIKQRDWAREKSRMIKNIGKT